MSYEFIVRFHALSRNNEHKKETNSNVGNRHDRDERVTYLLPIGLSFARQKSNSFGVVCTCPFWTEVRYTRNHGSGGGGARGGGF